MSFNRFYEDELSYLRDLGDEFSRQNPKLASFLSRKATDPDVERLLEGFAFLTARLRERLDSDLPEVAQGLVQMLWPHYLRPLPPMTLMAFEQSGAGTPDVVRVPRGTTIRSRVVSGIACTFRTCYDIDVMPLTVKDVSIDNRQSAARLTLVIETLPRGTLRALGSAPLRLYFNTDRDPQIGRSLYLWLLRNFVGGAARTNAGESVTIMPSNVRPLGFDGDHAVVPAPDTAFSGFRLIQEYLSFPQKFMFIEIGGLTGLQDSSGSELTLTLDFRRPFPVIVRPSREQFRLNATPAINLFNAEAQPIEVDRAKTEYRVLPAEITHSIHAVKRAYGHVQGRADRVEFRPFELYSESVMDRRDLGTRFRIRVASPVVGSNLLHYFSFADPETVPNAEVLSLRLSCSNGKVAELLAPGEIDQPGPNTPAHLTFANLNAPTPEAPPPISDILLWRLVANLARNFGSMADVSGLRTALAAHDFQALHDATAKRRLELLTEGLREFRKSDGDAMLHGQPIRIRRLVLTAEESKIGGEAELFLFGSVLDAFLSSYSNINNLHQLRVVGAETRVTYDWASRFGAAEAL